MDLINYKNRETTKSKALDSICIEKIPNEIGEYSILKKCVIYKNSLNKSIVLKCTNEVKEEYVIKIVCDPKEIIITKLKNVKSRYLMPIIGSGYIPDGMYYQIYPYYKKGSILNFFDSMDETDLLNLISDINEALKHLHDVGIVHMDIKLSNVFYDGNNYVLGDYDIAELCNRMIETDKEKEILKIIERDYSGKLYYSHRIDYILLRKMIEDMVSEKPKLRTYIINNIIRGLANKSKESVWGYDEIKQVAAGKYIENDKTAKARSLVKDKKRRKLIFGYDAKVGSLVAESLDELGDLFKKYRSYAIGRYINNKSNWKTLTDYIGFYDSEKGRQVEEVLDTKLGEIALDDIISIISDTPLEIYFRGERVISLKEDIISKLPTNECDGEFLQLCNSRHFKEFLCSMPREKQVFERAETVSEGNQELFYYLVIYQFLSVKVFEEEIAKCMHVDGTINNRSDLTCLLCTNKKMIGDYLHKIEAWLAVVGYHKEIKEIRKVCDKYEQ